MNLQHEQLLHRTRRQFLGEAGRGLGAAALAAMIGGAKRGDAGAMTSAAVTPVAETTTAAATAVMTEGGSRTTLKTTV